jgi:DNA-binding SARP family transcriptional activator
MEFGLLGPLTVRHGVRLLDIPRGKPRAVLAVLLSRTGQVVPADELMELIWDGRPPPSARPTLHNHVKRLRRALGEPAQARVRTSMPGYLVETGPDELDLTRFGTLCGDGRKAGEVGEWARAAEQFRAALSLWRGRPLLDICCPLLAVSEVPRLEELRASALENRIDADLHLGRHHEVIAELQQFAAGERLRERAHALLMLALYRAGRRADALAAYQLARRELVSELGLEPGAELRLLHQQILAADPGLDLAQASRPVAALGRPGPAANQEGTAAHPAIGEHGAAGRPRAGGALARTGRPHARHGSGPAGRGCHRRARRATDAAAARTVVPGQLPPTAGGFVGRVAERAMLTELTELPGRRARPPGTVGICVIAGGAGTGKTALAVHWAHQAADRFPDGQFYANLQGFGPANPVDPADAVRGFLAALGVSPSQVPTNAAAQAGLYRGLVAPRRMLVLLDNAADASQVRPLLPPSPGSLVVITSRNRLTGLAAADGARFLGLGPLTAAEAHEFLSHRLGPRRMADETGAVAELIRRCDGLPLALAAAAARLTSGSGLRVAGLIREFIAAGSPLDALDTGDAATSVRQVFSWSCQKLSAPAACLFQQIAVHAEPDITLPDAVRLAPLPADKARRLLAELAGGHLVTEHAPGRFSIHPLLRAYACEQARSARAWGILAPVTALAAPRPGGPPRDGGWRRRRVPVTILPTSATGVAG